MVIVNILSNQTNLFLLIYLITNVVDASMPQIWFALHFRRIKIIQPVP